MDPSSWSARGWDELRRVSLLGGGNFDVYGGEHGGGLGMRFFVGGDVGLVFESEADVIEAFEEAFLAEGVDRERNAQAARVGDDLIFEIGGEFVAFLVKSFIEELIDLRVGKLDEENAVLE